MSPLGVAVLLPLIMVAVGGFLWLWFELRHRHYKREAVRLKEQGEWLDAVLVAQQEENAVLEAEVICMAAVNLNNLLDIIDQRPKLWNWEEEDWEEYR